MRSQATVPFSNVSDDLPILLRSRFDSIAIQAAWEHVNLNPRYNFAREKEVDARMLDWFLGFFEGRTRTTPPNWWAESVSRAQFVDDRVQASLPLGKEYPRKGRAPYASPEGTTISKTADGYLLKTGKNSIVISRELAHLEGDIADCVSAAFFENVCFVTFHDTIGSPRLLLSINRRNGQLNWKSESCGILRGATGIHIGRLQILGYKDRVVVFGVSSMGVYAHGFCPDDGSTIFRFSTDF